MAAIDQIAYRQRGGPAIVAHHQIARILHQRLGDNHQRQRALAYRRRQAGAGAL